jgi:hypothetical protein
MSLTDAVLLTRLDLGFHSARISHEIESASIARQAAGSRAVHYLIKGNPRGMNLQALHADRIETQAIACLPHDGKRVWLWETQETSMHGKHAVQHHRIHRLIGQSVLLSDDAPVRHSAKHRRLKTVIQEIINVSAKVVVHARKRMNFGRHCPALSVFQRYMVSGLRRNPSFWLSDA